eukprot:4864850-Prymnesium_polylepis.1
MLARGCVRSCMHLLLPDREAVERGEVHVVPRVQPARVVRLRLARQRLRVAPRVVPVGLPDVRGRGDDGRGHLLLQRILDGRLHHRSL